MRAAQQVFFRRDRACFKTISRPAAGFESNGFHAVFVDLRKDFNQALPEPPAAFRCCPVTNDSTKLATTETAGESCLQLARQVDGRFFLITDLQVPATF
jgi:hypothetical protein